ncbi:phosphatidylserine decarboxylase [Malaciobacter marinus]|jgi:phosphatidylserine decarboxylase|uniref:phosphatidylserine decarboxylase n=1 Tax=Malaciobacter marinus TaxID=505249 RepID=UPI0009A7CF64|nr:phosphatidylserine decarboxylase [Malaciobacter marinus]SKB68850.1 phosphatidylserine decarboxylase [Malaciobacter marinus]
MHITNLISQYFGKFAKKEFPSFFQKFINNTYVKIFKIDMSEFRNAKYYKSLTDLFTRELAIPREINEEENSFISPSDSFITQCGSLHKETLFQIKGMEYSVEDLLTYYCTDTFPMVKDGKYMNFYLAPSEYHRYHAPIDCEIKKLIHVPGKLYPVNLKYLNKELDLFVQNERVILECFSNNKIFYMVFVGALNVGQMVFDFEPSVETNSNTKDIKVIKYDDLKVKKGQTLGYFKMGSTVVMVWEKDSVELEELLNQKVKYGQKIGILK